MITALVGIVSAAPALTAWAARCRACGTTSARWIPPHSPSSRSPCWRQRFWRASSPPAAPRRSIRWPPFDSSEPARGSQPVRSFTTAGQGGAGWHHWVVGVSLAASAMCPGRTGRGCRCQQHVGAGHGGRVELTGAVAGLRGGPIRYDGM